jgi:hypothetical protein
MTEITVREVALCVLMAVCILLAVLATAMFVSEANEKPIVEADLR